MKKLVFTLTIVLVLVAFVVPTLAGVYYFNSGISLPSSGAKYITGWYTKGNSTNGTRIWFNQTIGPLAAVNTRTQANLPGPGVVYANPELMNEVGKFDDFPTHF